MKPSLVGEARRLCRTGAGGEVPLVFLTPRSLGVKKIEYDKNRSTLWLNNAYFLFM